MSDRLEQNKATVVAFYDLMFNQCKPAEAIERYTVTSRDGKPISGNDGPFFSW